MTFVRETTEPIVRQALNVGSQPQEVSAADAVVTNDEFVRDGVANRSQVDLRPHPPQARSVHGPQPTELEDVPVPPEHAALTAALGAHQPFTEHTASRFRAVERALALEPRTAQTEELSRLTGLVSDAFQSGDMRAAATQIVALFESVGSNVDESSRAEAIVRRALSGVVDRMEIDGRRSNASVAVRYAEHVRAFHSAQGNKGVGPDNPDFWDELRNSTIDLAFRIPWGEPSVMSTWQDSINAPPEMLEAFLNQRTEIEDPHDVVRLAATLAGRHAHQTDGWVCRHAAELTRELLMAGGFDAAVSTLMEPFGHAYVTVDVDGREMFVDGYFDPRGVMYQSMDSVERFGFATPGDGDAPRF
ncbi:MAG: hypothetical protein AAFQ82_12245 [Myxococcota bacterium]